MTDAEFEQQQARIEACVLRWVPLLGLDDWRIVREYRRQDNADLDNGDGTMSFGRCHVQWPYMEARITFWTPQAEDFDDEHLELIVVHELMHVVLHEMCDDAKTKVIRHEERVATVLAKAFLRTRASGAEAEAEE